MLVGPDEPVWLNGARNETQSVLAGAFLQDSWSVFDKVTVNLGIRYDSQYLWGADGKLGLSLPNQWSPRAGVIYDFTQSGRSKVFVNYARYYQVLPLDLADVALSGEPHALASRAVEHVRSEEPGSSAAELQQPDARRRQRQPQPLLHLVRRRRDAHRPRHQAAVRRRDRHRHRIRGVHRRARRRSPIRGAG